jgi:hypothetical protein
MSTLRGDKKDNPVIIYSVLLLASVAFMIIGYLLDHFWSLSLFAQLATEMGIALTIGVILALTIERLSAIEFRRLAQEERDALKRNVFYYVYGRALPEAIRDEIDAQILKSNFLRSGLLLKFLLSTVEDPNTGETFIQSKCLVRYNVVNITNQPQVFPIRSSSHKSPIASLADRTKFLHFRAAGVESPIDLDEEALSSMRSVGETDISLRPEITVPIPARREASVALEYQAIRTLSGGHILFALSTHACDLELLVQVPGREVTVLAAANAHNNPLMPTDAHEPSSGYYNWKIGRPLLPYQSIYVTWTPNSAANSPPPPTANGTDDSEAVPTAVPGGTARSAQH